MESYWDLLPPEIKEYILTFKESQELIDRRESVSNRALCNEIEGFAKLRLKWFIGPLRYQPRSPKICHCQPRCYYTNIFGHYWDLDGTKRQIFLGYHFHLALNVCDFFKDALEYRVNDTHSEMMWYYLFASFL